jgi:NAD-dependent DNA ligase
MCVKIIEFQLEGSGIVRRNPRWTLARKYLAGEGNSKIFL